MKIVLSGVLEGLSTRNDGSVKVAFVTQELDPSTGGQLFQLRNKFVKCLISDSNISPIEEELVDSTELKGGKKAKSQSQRLRAVLYRVHEQQGIPLDFETWYNSELETIIEQYRNTLE